MACAGAGFVLLDSCLRFVWGAHGKPDLFTRYSPRIDARLFDLDPKWHTHSWLHAHEHRDGDPHPGRRDKPFSRRGGDRDVDGHTFEDADCHRYLHPDWLSHPHADRHSNVHSHAFTIAYPEFECPRHPRGRHSAGADRHGGTFPHTHADKDRDPHPFADVNVDCHPHTLAHHYSQPKLHRNQDSNANAASNEYIVAYSNDASYPDLYVDGDDQPCSSGNLHGHLHRDADSHIDAETLIHPTPDDYLTADINSYIHPKPNPDTYAATDVDLYTHGNEYLHADDDPPTHADPDAFPHTHGDLHAHVHPHEHGAADVHLHCHVDSYAILNGLGDSHPHILSDADAYIHPNAASHRDLYRYTQPRALAHTHLNVFQGERLLYRQ